MFGPGPFAGLAFQRSRRSGRLPRPHRQERRLRFDIGPSGLFGLPIGYIRERRKAGENRPPDRTPKGGGTAIAPWDRIPDTTIPTNRIIPMAMGMITAMDMPIPTDLGTDMRMNMGKRTCPDRTMRTPAT